MNSRFADSIPLAVARTGPELPVLAASRVATLKRVSRVAGAAVAAAGALVLLGWLLDIGVLKSVMPGFVTMKANTALGFVLAGAALYALNSDAYADGRRAFYTAAAGAIAVTAIGLLTLGQYVAGIDLGIDQLLFSEPATSVQTYGPGRMSLRAALLFSLLGLGLAFLSLRPARYVGLVQAVAFCTLLVSLTSIAGYVHGAGSLYRIAGFTAMALHTAVLFSILATGILCVRPEQGRAMLIASDGPEGVTIRKLWLPSVIALLLLSWTLELAEQAGLMSEEVGSAMQIILGIVLLSAIVWRTALSLEREDVRRSRAEAGRRQLLAELERRVEQRTAALSAAEERSRVMFESAPTAMVMADATGTIVQVNTQALALFGYARDELIGKPVEMLVPQRARGARPAQRAGFFTRPQVRRTGEIRDLHARRKDGREIPVEIGLNPISTAQGVFVLSAIVDLTERTRTLDEINNLNVALVLQADQLELANRELESFSYSVSHDLRAPLRAMDGFALALLEDYGARLDAEGKDALERIRAASRNMGELIDDLLRLANVTRTALCVQPVDLSALARECADALERGEPGRSVQWQIEPGLRLAADVPLMRIAIQNLLENAWKFSGKKERATIRVGAVERDGGKAFFVADDGAGFDLAHAGRMFEAFQRLHHESEFKGSGIGLAIVKRIVQRHGGRIWAESTPGAGAAVYFTAGNKEGGSRE